MAVPDDNQRPFSILFVCTANICRSPLAQELLLMALGDAAERFGVASAGTNAHDNMPMDPAVAAELRRLGGDPTGFRSRRLTDNNCEEADLILTATRDHRSQVLDQVPRALRRTFTLLEFAHIVDGSQSPAGPLTLMVSDAAAARGAIRPENYDIADPYGGTPEDHRRAADTILPAVTVIGARLSSSV